MSHENEIISSQWDQIISFSWDILKWETGSGEPPLDPLLAWWEFFMVFFVTYMYLSKQFRPISWVYSTSIVKEATYRFLGKHDVTLNCLQLMSADKLCKEFGSRPGLTKCQAWSRIKLFDTLMIFLKEYFQTFNFEKKSADNKKHAKLPSMQRLKNFGGKIIFSNVPVPRLRQAAFLFVWFDSLRPSQQSLNYVGTGLPGLNQY